MIESYDNIASLIDLFIRYLLKALCSTKQELRSFDEAHSFHFDGRCERTNSIGSCREQNASITSLREIFSDDSNIISVIKDQQPALLALLQPAFDCGHELTLVRLASC